MINIKMIDFAVWMMMIYLLMTIQNAPRCGEHFNIAVFLLEYNFSILITNLYHKRKNGTINWHDDQDRQVQDMILNYFTLPVTKMRSWSHPHMIPPISSGASACIGSDWSLGVCERHYPAWRICCTWQHRENLRREEIQWMVDNYCNSGKSKCSYEE